MFVRMIGDSLPEAVEPLRPEELCAAAVDALERRRGRRRASESRAAEAREVRGVHGGAESSAQL